MNSNMKFFVIRRLNIHVFLAMKSFHATSLLLLVLLSRSVITYGQDDPELIERKIVRSSDHDSTTVLLGLEYRPRTEFRNGYRAFPQKGSSPAFFTSHRGRIRLDVIKKGLHIRATLQDVRVWGDTDTRDAEGKAQFFEFYAEPIIGDHMFLRVGRQRIMYDDERLFAQNQWRQTGGKHDAIRLMLHKEALQAEVFVAFNQPYESNFGTAFPVAWDTYRGLVGSYLRWVAGEHITITAINFADEYTDPSSGDTRGYWKLTNGGRIAFNNLNWYATIAAYYQWGNIENGKTHNAYYLQPEVRYTASKNYSVRLGLQLLSGDRDPIDNKSGAFLAQYGAFHRYNGRMDYTQLTVRTNEHEGIVNPYLILDFTFSKKWRLSWEMHALGTQQLGRLSAANPEAVNLDRWFGWENDLMLRYRVNDFTAVEFAYLFLLPGEALEYLPTGNNGRSNGIAQFAYLAVTWTPDFFN